MAGGGEEGEIGHKGDVVRNVSFVLKLTSILLPSGSLAGV